MGGGSLSKRIVVDASIFRSAGEGTDTTAKACREVLDAILSICHKVVFSYDIYDEWKRHKSNYSATWIASMNARKKVIKLNEVHLPEIRQRVLEIPALQRDRLDIEKDIMLLEAALETDCIVLTRDQRICDRFKEAATAVGEIGHVLFVNPELDLQNTLSWLAENAPTLQELTLAG